MRKKLIIVVAALALIGITTYYFVNKKGSSNTQANSTSTQQSTQTQDTQPATDNYVSKVTPASKCITTTESKTILYCDSGFSDYLNVIVGEVVTVKNSSSKVLDFETYASAPENSTTYSVNLNMNLGKINPGETKSFVAKPIGEYKYRDNNIPSHTGILGIKDDL